MNDFKAAAADAKTTVKLKPDWPKGHVRVGAAAMGLGRFTDAREAYERALALDPENEQMQSSLEQAKTKEEEALRSGKFTFQSVKRKNKEGGDGGGAGDAAADAVVGKVKKRIKHAGVRNEKLLSFADEDE